MDDKLLPFRPKELTPEEMLEKLAGSTKFVIAFYDSPESLNTFIGEDLTHMELVYIIDTLRKRSDDLFE
jgi:hypothetical protein